MSTQASVYIDRFYEMDPQFEDMIPGTDLRNGMIVVLEDSLLRGDPERATGEDAAAKYERAKCRQINRWCEVTNLAVVDRYDIPSPLVKFLGVYADGTKYPRTYDSSYHWIVKRDSMTKEAL